MVTIDDEQFLRIDLERKRKKSERYLYSTKIKSLNNSLLFCKELSIQIQKEAQSYYTEEDFNFYSNSFLPENIVIFYESIMLQNKLKLKKGISYLEIGINKGISLFANAIIAKHYKVKLCLTGIDPYFKDGYIEGELRQINKNTKNKMLGFLSEHNIQINHIEKTSREAFKELLCDNKKFDIIYIDGAHEKLFPLVDIGSYINLLNKGGIILIDDYFWRDVYSIKCLLDKYAIPLMESWKIAAYQLNTKNPIF